MSVEESVTVNLSGKYLVSDGNGNVRWVGMELEIGFRLLEDDEYFVEGDKMWYKLTAGWERLNSSYFGKNVRECKNFIHSWWTGPLYFATNRPEPLVIGKLLESLK